MTRKLLKQDAFVGLRKLGVGLDMITKLFTHIAQNPGEWADVEKELLKRCERGDTRICGMGFVDEVRRERKALGLGGFVFNNNWSPYYCRLFVLKYPEYRERFEFRALKQKEAA